MIKKVIIKNSQGKVIFKGPLVNLKFKSESIKKTSIELFNDEDPCIIHQSYATETLASKVERYFNQKGLLSYIIDEALMDALDDVDFTNYIYHTLELEVK